MAGDSVSRIAAGDAARAALTVLLALAALVVGPTAIATATPPTLAIEQPLTGSVTNDQLPVFSGSGDEEGPVTVKIFAGESTEPIETLVTLLPPFEGKWELAEEAPLAAGQYTAVAEQELEGAPTTSEPVTFTIDTTAPAVSIDPAASRTNNPTPTLTGELGTEPGDSATVAVTVYEGATASGKIVSTGEAATAGAAWSYTPAQLADGTYTAQAIQKDEAGNTGTSSTVTFTVDTEAPEVSIDPVISPTDSATPALGGGTGTASGDVAVVAVTVYKGSSAGGEVASAGPATVEGSTWSYTPAHLPDGTYTAQATQADEAGNTGTSATTTFTVDTQAPKMSIASVASPTNDATPTITGAPGTEPGDSSTVEVTVYEGASAGGKVASSGKATVEGSAWSYISAHLADGVYTARATQADAAGNTGTSSTTTFTVDTVAPALTISAPTEGAVLNVSSVTLSGLAGQASGDHALVTLKIYAGGSTAGTPAETLEITPAAGKWTTGANSPTLTNGLYTVLAEQSDDAGNVRARTDTFTIKTSSPVVTLDTSGFTKRGAVNFTDATPSFSGSASTAPEDSETVHVKIFNGSSASGSPISTLDGALSGPKWSAGPTAALVDGAPYTVQATQEDEAGHIGKSTPVTFTVDAVAPSVTLTSPADASTTTSSSEPLAGAAGTAPGDSAKVTVQLYAGSSATGTPLQAVVVQASAGKWSATAGGLEPGTYTARAEQSDDVGNVGLSAPATFTVTKPEPKAEPKSEPPPVTPPVTPPVITPVTPPAPIAIPPVVSAATLMQPFPVVRIAGSVTSSGAKLNLLAVQAPVGTIVSISCHGHGCPAKSRDTVSAAGRSKSKSGLVLITFRRFERALGAGATLQIKIYGPGQIGKYTRFTIRRGKLPLRLDTCLSTAGKSISCPS